MPSADFCRFTAYVAAATAVDSLMSRCLFCVSLSGLVSAGNNGDAWFLIIRLNLSGLPS